MGNRFASGKNAISQCDRCDQRFKLSILKREVIKGRNYDLLVCPECWDPDQPQLHLGEFPVDDPINVNGGTGPTGTGTVEAGSRIFQWGWSPVGGSSFFDAALTPNNLVLSVQLGTVSVSTT